MVSIGTIAWAVLTLLIVVLVPIIAALLFKQDDSEATTLGVAAITFLVVWLIGSAFGMYPYKAEYHSYRPASGTVEKIDNRLISSGKSMETKFVVKFTNNSQLYGCDDTRCASTKPGDKLELLCIRDWQYAGVDGYTCKYNQ